MQAEYINYGRCCIKVTSGVVIGVLLSTLPELLLDCTHTVTSFLLAKKFVYTTADRRSHMLLEALAHHISPCCMFDRHV